MVPKKELSNSGTVFNLFLRHLLVWFFSIVHRFPTLTPILWKTLTKVRGIRIIDPGRFWDRTVLELG